MKKHIMLIFLLFIFSACNDQLLNDEYEGGDWFYLENNGAVMPVWVRGNKLSNVFIIFLHGGPGTTSLEAAISSAHKQLQNDYAFVYYDQRGSGGAQGNTKPESFTVEQFVEDLQKIVYVIRYKYNNPIIFLIGHSWGGGLGTAYLLSTENQKYISGWIGGDTAHNFEEGMILSWEWVKDKANAKIDAGIDVNYWKKELDWYNTASYTWDNFMNRHVNNVDKLDGYYYNASNKTDFPRWTAPLPILYFLNFNYIQKRFNLEKFNLTSQMYKITVPSMICWGRHDGILPVKLAQDAYDNLGTDSNDKYLCIFEHSAHNPAIEETDIFVYEVKDFIEKYRYYKNF
jgi:pimeloyl-ACP methyl ester carboxylesterase